LRPLDFSDTFFKVARASSFCLSDLTTWAWRTSFKSWRPRRSLQDQLVCWPILPSRDSPQRPVSSQLH
jgi:hypothetical protein